MHKYNKPINYIKPQPLWRIIAECTIMALLGGGIVCLFASGF